MDRGWVDEGENGDRAQLSDILRVIAAAHGRFFAGTAAGFAAKDAVAAAAAATAAANTPEGRRKEFPRGDSTTQAPKVTEDEARDLLESRDVRRLLAVPGDGPLRGARLTFSPRRAQGGTATGETPAVAPRHVARRGGFRGRRAGHHARRRAAR